MNLITVYGNMPYWQPNHYGVVDLSVSDLDLHEAISNVCEKAIEDVFTSDKQGRSYDATILHGRSVISDMIEQHNVILFTTQKPEAVVVIVPDDNPEDVILFFVASRELSLTITLQCC